MTIPVNVVGEGFDNATYDAWTDGHMGHGYDITLTEWHVKSGRKKV